MWIVTVRSPVSGPAEYILKTGRNTVGRNPANDIVVSDELASRLHAEIECESSHVVIKDLNSTNGTFVNRERIIEPCVLHSDDQIRIGQHVATVTFSENGAASHHKPDLSDTQPVTRNLLLQSVEQNPVLLYEISSRLSTIVDLNLALQEVSTVMRTAIGADRFEVILRERFPRIAEMGFPVSLARKAIDKRSVVAISDLMSSGKRELSESAKLLKIHSVLCVPVIVNDDVEALIYAYKTDGKSRPFDQHDVQLAVGVSHQVSLTLERTRLLEQVRVYEHWAITDSLTGLPNRRQILRHAELEFQRALRFNHPLSVMMIDIDSFKHVNDTYGHPVGDQVLSEVVARCKQGLRKIDLLGRYGGDEFICLLVETELESAREAAERTRQRVMETPIKTDRGPLNITISIGVASLSAKHASLSAALSSADDALYVAKKTGKNKVEVSA
ncbi:MAG: diguanylate cyclase [Chloroflexi bacterium]|nr:diguanylate cyclase [Chloroflexota bacterium]